MIFIQHRVNKISDLKIIEDSSLGCEIDIRTDLNKTGRFLLSHDPWSVGDDFENWLQTFIHKKLKGPLILNTKEDGLESEIILLLKKYSLFNYFFLDTTIPSLVKNMKSSNRFAVRFSKYEPKEMMLAFADHAKWLWVDGFDGCYPDPFTGVEKFSICLVSPELQLCRLELNEQIKKWLPISQAICTKSPEQWRAMLENKTV